MKLMKKAMALLLVGAMALMFAACTVPNMTGTNTNNANTNTDTGYTNAQIENLIADLDMSDVEESGGSLVNCIKEIYSYRADRVSKAINDLGDTEEEK